MHMKSHTSLEQQLLFNGCSTVDMCNDDDDDEDDDEMDGDLVYDLVDERPTYCDICGKKFMRSNGNMRTHKCTKRSSDDDMDRDEQTSTIDIWNCE